MGEVVNFTLVFLCCVQQDKEPSKLNGGSENGQKDVTSAGMSYWHIQADLRT